MLAEFRRRYRWSGLCKAKSRIRTGLIDPIHIDIGLSGLEMRMVARFIHSQDRSKAGVGALEKITPLIS